jgi:hypothetical protein
MNQLAGSGKNSSGLQDTTGGNDAACCRGGNAERGKMDQANELDPLGPNLAEPLIKHSSLLGDIGL